MIWIVVVVIAPLAALLFAGAFGLLDQLGRTGLAIDEPPRPSPSRAPDGPLARAEREAEIRQFVQARQYRQAGRGEPPVDVESEVERLLALAGEEVAPDRGDAALREEVRQLALARNERRVARGDPPLDIEAEVERQLREAGG